MSKKPDGGNAFPGNNSAGYDEPGMTLRDYFAGRALSGAGTKYIGDEVGVEWFRQFGAKHCYQLADAMLKAREE